MPIEALTLHFFPFRYLSVLPDYTLTTRIREKSWKLSELFPVLRQTTSKFKGFVKAKINSGNKAELKHQISLLATEIRTGFKDLKIINFYDSAILYLYFRLLHHVFNLCEKEHKRLIAEKEKELSEETKLKEQKVEDIKKAKRDIENKIKAYGKIIHGFEIAEHELIEVDAKLLNILRKLRWKAEKRAQHEFSFEELTLRSMENLNRKIKIEAMKVKKVIPHKIFLMKKIQKQGKINTEDVVALAKIVSEAIDRINKDVSYSSKLIAKFQDEIEMLKKEVEKLKKAINKSKQIKEDEAREIVKPWDDAIKYVEEESHKDLMQIFRNIFVLYKKAATEQLQAA